MTIYAQVDWRASCRLVPSRYPTIRLFEDVADPADLDVLYAIADLTNPRLRDEVGDLQLVPSSERVSGEGTSAIMAAFTHLNPHGSRFSDGTYGVYYAGECLDTAIAEVSYHAAWYLANTDEPPIEVDYRCYRVTLDAELAELRSEPMDSPLLDPNNYNASQAFGRELRTDGANGIVFPSVRHAGGECVALFTPRATVPPARQSEHVTLRWNGSKVTDWYLKSGNHQL